MLARNGNRIRRPARGLISQSGSKNGRTHLFHFRSCVTQGNATRTAGMSSKRLDSLGDYLRHHYRLRLECHACRRVVIQDPLYILNLCQKRGWGHQIHHVERRLRCGECGSRDVRLGPAFGS